MAKVKVGEKKAPDIDLQSGVEPGIRGDQIVPVITKSLREHGWVGTVRTLKLDCEDLPNCKASLAFDDKGQTTIFDFKIDKNHVGVAVSESTGGGPTTKSGVGKFDIVAGKVTQGSAVTVFDGQNKRLADKKRDPEILEALADGRVAAQAAVSAMKIEGRPAPTAPAATAEEIAKAVAEKLKPAPSGATP